MSKSTLETLIKRTKMELDQKRQILALELEKQDQLEQQIEDKKQSIIDELREIQNSPEYFQTFFQFQARMTKAIDEDQTELAKTVVEIEALRNHIRNDYSEMRKLDIALEQFSKHQKLEEGRKNQRDLDELASTRSTRKSL